MVNNPSVSKSRTHHITFQVNDVSPCSDPMPQIPYFDAVKQYLKSFSPNSKIESCSDYRGKLVGEVDYPLIEYNPLVAAVHHAFSFHYPLCLSPDMIWLLIAQGFANHVNANAEKLRDKFVSHQGKKLLKVRRDDFIKGTPENPWTEVFSEFSAQIRQHIGGVTHDLLVPTFSTTGLVEKAAAEVVLMDAMQSYFEYLVMTRCGIPSIRLEGTVEDWQSLRQKTLELAQFDLGWWIESLEPILDQFILAAQGKSEPKFWESIYKFHGAMGSGLPYITGLITAFFPYLLDNSTGKAIIKNKVNLDSFNDNYEGGKIRIEHEVTTEMIPRGLAKAPFKWQYHRRTFSMEFLAGFVGIKQDNEGFLRPEIGWVILQNK